MSDSPVHVPMSDGYTARSPRSTRPNRISSLILFLTVAAAPLPFGSTNSTTIAFWCIVLGVASVVVSPRRLLGSHFVLLWLVGITIAAYAVVLHEQLASRPWFATSHPIWVTASETMGMPIEQSISIARHQPFFALGLPLANMLALVCSFVVCADRTRARQLLKVVAWSGTAYAGYGIAAHLIDPTRILWREKQAYLDVLTSTFVNRNSAAVYFGSCALVWLLLSSEHIRRSVPARPIRWTRLAQALLIKPSAGTVVSIAMMFTCLVAMFMTASRAGIVLSLGMLIVTFFIYWYRDFPRRSGAIIAVGVILVLVLILLQTIGAGFGGRIDFLGFADEGRFETYRSTLRMISDHRWFGTGLGTFATSFPAYRSDGISLSGTWDLAHSTPLELAADLGLPLAGLIGLSWVVALLVMARGVRLRRWDRIIPLAGLAIAILALGHSLIDFSLQIAGYSIPVFALTGAGIAQSLRSRSEKKEVNS